MVEIEYFSATNLKTNIDIFTTKQGRICRVFFSRTTTKMTVKTKLSKVCKVNMTHVPPKLSIITVI